MNYTLNQLRIFLKVAQTESITKAAEELHLTQPAVSIQLRNFQQQFDIPLTEVVNKKLFITDFGREIVTSAENILNEVYAMNARTLAFKGKLTGRLKISVVSTGKYVIPFFLSAFLKEHDGVELNLDVSNKAMVAAGLENNLVDFSLVSVLPEAFKLNRIDLMQNKLFLVGSHETDFGRQSLNKRLLESLPLIYREEGSATRRVMESFLAKNGIRVQKKIVLTSNEAVKQAVIAGLGFSIMPLIGIRNELMNRQLRILPIRGLPIRSTWHLVWLAGKKHSPVAAAFIQHLRKEKANIIKQHFGWFEEY